MQSFKLPSVKTLLKICSSNKIEIIFSTIFTSIIVVGYILSNDPTSLGIYKKIAYFTGFIVIWIMVFFGLKIIKQKTLTQTKRTKTIFLKSWSDRKLWLTFSALIFIFYIPIIILCLSVMTSDSWAGIEQIVGKEPLSQAHPLIFTIFTGVFIRLGLLFDNLELGTVFFSIAQSAILAMIFAYTITWMRKQEVGRNGIFVTFIFYAILPINAFAGIIMWKDILFAGIGLLFLISLRELYVKIKNGDLNKNNAIYFVILAFIFCVWRNNAIYAYLLMTFIILVFQYKIFLKKKYVFIILMPIVLYTGYSTINSLFAKPPNPVESMSVPLQQIARTVKYDGASLSTKDRETINEVLPYDKLPNLYNPQLSDPVKASFRLSVYNSDKDKYIKQWLRLSNHHTKTYIESFLYNTYGYVYPFHKSTTPTNLIVNNEDQVNKIFGYHDPAISNKGKLFATTYNNTIISIFPLLQNIGLYTCVLILCMYIAIIKKRRELFSVFTLIICLFLTTILGPVNGEFRYLYLFVVATPFIITSSFSNRKF